MPNTGLVFGIDGEIDAWAERGVGSQYAVPGLDVYVPMLRSTHTGVRLGARGLIQSRGALLNTSAFVPRGDDIDALRDGTFLQLEAEVTQPVVHRRRKHSSPILREGPLGLRVWRGVGVGWRWNVAASRHLGWGGAQSGARLFYRFNVDLRIGAAYRPGTNEVQAVYR